MKRRALLLIPMLAGALSCTYCGGDKTPAADEDEDAEAPPTGVSASFVTFGDWGTGGDSQQEVAEAIDAYCQQTTCEFVLTLGDNFYDDGVESASDEQWETKYKAIYGDLGLPFYPSLGNHDTAGNEEAQVQYSSVDSSWRMPGEYYSFVWPGDTDPPLVEFFIFNSDDFDAEQQEWLRASLDGSTATWKFLVMHHPIYSNGQHGDDDQGNNAALLPIVCNKIDLVLSGHDHNFSHLRSAEDGCPIEQLVVGTGGAGLRSVTTTDPRVLATASIYGFGWLQVTSGEIAFRMVQRDGSVYYQTSWQKP